MEQPERVVPPILIIDDDPASRLVLEALLTRAGYPVLSAGGGREAFELLAQDPLPGLILLDLIMPEMNGWVFRIEQQRDPRLARIPVVIVSGAQDPAPAARFLHAAGCLTKPVDSARLVEMVRELVG